MYLYGVMGVNKARNISEMSSLTPMTLCALVDWSEMQLVFCRMCPMTELLVWHDDILDTRMSQFVDEPQLDILM